MKLRNLDGYTSAPAYLYSQALKTAPALPNTDAFFAEPKAGAVLDATFAEASVQTVAAPAPGMNEGQATNTTANAPVNGRPPAAGTMVHLLPREIAGQLKLTDQQQAQIAELETEVSAKLAKILTTEQQARLKQFRPPRREDGAEQGVGNDDTQRAPAGREDGAVGQQAAGDNKQADPAGQQQAPTFVLRSTAFANGGTLPTEFTGDGDGVTPPLNWTGAPDGTKSYALIMRHTDVEGVHKCYWILYNIPATVQSLPKNVKDIGTLGINSLFKTAAYAPPHSKGPGPKTYTISVYALSSALQLSSSSGTVNQQTLLTAMQGYVLARADLKMVYTRYTDNTGAAQS